MNYKAVIGILVLGFIILFGMQSLQKNKAPETKITTNENTQQQTPLTFKTETKMRESNPVAVFTTNKGNFEVELFIDKVPATAGNFKKLAEEGFYDGTKFHRIIADFMVQGGDPLTKDDSKMSMWGTGDPGYKFPDEFGEGLSNVPGTISMANSGPNTNGSQFFINVNDNSFLDYNKEPLSSKHSVFGKVISGMEVVMQLATVETLPGSNRPVEAVVVESVVIK